MIKILTIDTAQGKASFTVFGSPGCGTEPRAFSLKLEAMGTIFEDSGMTSRGTNPQPITTTRPLNSR